VGGISTPYHPQLGKPAVFIYDGHAGGVGLCREAFARVGKLLARTLSVITACPCEAGCPSCVHSPKCGSGNRPIDKEAARQLLIGLGADHEDGCFSRVEVMNDHKQSYQLPVAAQEPAVMANASRIPARYGVFDLETQKSAAEVGGWHRADKMLVSVGVVYDSGRDDYLIFREGEVRQLIAHLRTLEVVVGFNNKRFDNQVLSGYEAHDLAALPTVDILEKVKQRLGYRISLNNLAESTLGIKKNADGLMALKWYREGRVDKIIAYCRRDVEVTRNLYRFGLEHGYLLFTNKAGSLVRCQVDLQPER
jgi:DEAD/DEAH box helicase domain-containing protein